MNMLKMRRWCRGGIFVAFLCLMSISLTGCAWLATLAPILSAIGSVAGMVGSIVSIFSPETGSKISQVGNAISSTGQGLQDAANQMAGQQTGQSPTTSTPTGVSAPTTTEDGATSSPGTSSPVTTTTTPGSSSSSSTSSSAGVSAPPVSGTAASNAQSMLSGGFISRGAKSSDGRLNLTQYGGPSDRTPDKYTQMGLGNRNNKLRPTSLALSPDLIRKYGLKGGETISIKTPNGTRFLGHYDDTTGNRNGPNVIDIYDKTDSLGKDNFLATIPAGQWQLVIGPRQ